MKKILVALLILGIALVCGSDAYAEKMLQIKGSDTLINLVQRLSEVYMQKNPGKYISVTGGGSGTGIAAIINGKCDIANASRNMKPKEIENAAQNGVQAKRVVVAIDGLSVITNDSNPINLTVDQVGKIYRGEVKNWSEVGGPNRAITLYGRQSNSGTFSYFRDYILKGEYSAQMRRMNGNSQIVEAVRQDDTAIGYVGVGYVKNASGINVVKVAIREGASYESPLDKKAVISGAYPIARPLNQYVNGTPTGAVKDFIVFELSAEGQKIVDELGFFPLGEEYIEYNKKSVGL